MLGVIRQTYLDGREIHLGDTVTYNLQRGRVVFVAARGEFASSYEQTAHASGFMIEFENGARLLLESADELLVLEVASGSTSHA